MIHGKMEWATDKQREKERKGRMQARISHTEIRKAGRAYDEVELARQRSEQEDRPVSHTPAVQVEDRPDGFV